MRNSVNGVFSGTVETTMLRTASVRNDSASTVEGPSLGARERGVAAHRMKVGMKAVFAVACLGLAACTSDLESSDPAPPAVEHSAPGNPTIAAGASDVDRARATNSPFDLAAAKAGDSAFVCRKNAFCEDFEQKDWSTRWHDLVKSTGGTIETSTASASHGGGSLRLSAPDAAATAFLLSEQNDVAGPWSGIFAFAFRVDQLPTTALGGPEMTVNGADGPVTVRIALEPKGLVLQQLADPSCKPELCAPRSTVIAAAQANHWYRIRVGFEVSPRQAEANHGRIEMSVDGGELQSTILSVPMFDGPVTMRAGITQADTKTASANLDDLTLLIRP